MKGAKNFVAIAFVRSGLRNAAELDFIGPDNFGLVEGAGDQGIQMNGSVLIDFHWLHVCKISIGVYVSKESCGVIMCEGSD